MTENKWLSLGWNITLLIGVSYFMLFYPIYKDGDGAHPCIEVRCSQQKDT